MEDKIVKRRFNIIAIILIIIISIAIAPKTLQNDTFYTIKIGEYILENGITMEDPFSWHDGLKYTYPHWLYDVIIYLFYNVGGQLGVYISTMIFTAIMGLIIYLTNCKLTKNRLTSFIITVGVIVLMQKYIAARAQLVTFSLFALTVYFIEMFLETKKKRYAIGLIIIPILLANLHVAVFWFYFILYMPYIGEYVIAILSEGTIIKKFKLKRIEKKLNKTKDETQIEKLNLRKKQLQEKIEKNQAIYNKRNSNPYKIIINKNDNIKYLILIMIICLFAGLVSPLGDVPYTYLYNTMKGNTTR